MENYTPYPIRQVSPVNTDFLRNLLQFNKPPVDDVEIIDLDDPRANVKPTTWHK